MKKQYEWVSFDVAINLLRPRAKWKIDHGKLQWLDPRPCPTMKEVEDTLNKIKDFESGVFEKIKSEKPEIIDEIQSSGKLNETTEQLLSKTIEEYKEHHK